MDLLEGYGSGSEGEEQCAEEPCPTNILQTELTGDARRPYLPTNQVVHGTSNEFSLGNIKPRKPSKANFSCGIDYGPAEGVVDVEHVPTENKRARHAKANSEHVSIADVLPAPKHAFKPLSDPKNRVDALNKHGQSDYGLDDADAVHGEEGPSGMHLGKRVPDQAGEGEGDPRIELDSGYIEGEYNGVRYLYHQLSGQYFYPESDDRMLEKSFTSHSGSTTDPVVGTLVALASERGVASAGVEFKEVSGAALRYMNPGQRAEADAVRSALGADYESRLKVDAAKVGSVSKLAKSRHQLASLYVASKQQELDQIEKRTVGMKTKAETQRKYGW